MIDYYEASGYGLPHYAAVLTSRGYTYGTDYLPHDAQARQLGTGRSLWETLHSLTNRIPRVLPQQNLMDGINAARVSIASCWFDADKCHDGLEALRAYRADYDDKRKAFTDRPRHDWASPRGRRVPLPRPRLARDAAGEATEAATEDRGTARSPAHRRAQWKSGAWRDER